jgi:uncharacterized protein DUF3108
MKIRETQYFIPILFASCTVVFAANWETTLTKGPPGNFPELRPLHASYRFGWSGFTAATGEVHFSKPDSNRFEFEGTGRTIGLVRALWKFDVSHRAVANAQTLHPIETHQTESYRSKKIVTDLAFSNGGVSRTRTENEHGSEGAKTRQFNMPDLFDLHSAALYLRSQPLKNHAGYRIVVYPATNRFLCMPALTMQSNWICS